MCGFFFFQAEDGIRDLVRSRGLGDVYKRQDPATVETNIIMLDVGRCGWPPGDFVTAAAAQGVRLYAAGPRSVRAVWHLDVDDAATDHAERVLSELLATGGRPTQMGGKPPGGWGPPAPGRPARSG